MENETITPLPDALIKFGKYMFLPQKRELRCGQQSFRLTEREKDLLVLFCDFANQLLPRHYALISVWKNDTYFNSRSMDVYVSRLRKFLKMDTDIAILNIHGKGFKLIVPQIEIVS